jgi:two-component system sensor histidine kinase SenX3
MESIAHGVTVYRVSLFLKTLSKQLLNSALRMPFLQGARRGQYEGSSFHPYDRGVSMRWKKEESSAELRSLSIPDYLVNVLDVIDAEYLLLEPGEVVVKNSREINSLGLIRDNKLNSEQILNLVRAVRRSNKYQEATLELPRGPVGAGTHDLLVRVSLVGTEGLALVLIFDDSEFRRLDAVRRDFVANISHELKTPIGALSLLSEAVMGASDDPEAVTKFATRMQIEAGRLSDLVQEIINLSRLQGDDPLVGAKSVDVTDLVSQGIDDSRLSAEARKISVQFTPVLHAKVLGDRTQLEMAISNLIENAINYSPEGTQVIITEKCENDLIEITVTDQGIGIPEKDLERIFERFYRVDPARSRQTGGTGLGLSIVKHVITNHGGDVSVWSAEGAGSTFTIRLPQFQPSKKSETEK